MFVKQKQCVNIKGRGCVNGENQRFHNKKEDIISPKVKTESMFLFWVINAKENRDVATCDISGAFMPADMDEKIYVILTLTLYILLE